jgi:regulator of RNase E activity RraB
MTFNQLSKAAIDAFKSAYELEFDESLTDEQVREIALGLLQFCKVLDKTN